MLAAISRRVAHNGYVGRYITSDDAARANHGTVPHSNARQDDGSSADPYVSPDLNWTAELQAQGALAWVPRMIGGQDPDVGPDLRPIAYRHTHNIQKDATEVEEHARSEPDVVSIVAMERRAHSGSLPNMRHPFREQHSTLRLIKALGIRIAKTARREYRAIRRLIGGRVYPLRLECNKAARDKTGSITLLWKPPANGR